MSQLAIITNGIRDAVVLCRDKAAQYRALAEKETGALRASLQERADNQEFQADLLEDWLKTQDTVVRTVTGRIPSGPATQEFPQSKE